MRLCATFFSPALCCVRTNIAELTTVHDLKRPSLTLPADQDRPVRLAAMERRNLINIILSFHVIPQAFTTALSLIFCEECLFLSMVAHTPFIQGLPLPSRLCCQPGPFSLI